MKIEICLINLLLSVLYKCQINYSYMVMYNNITIYRNQKIEINVP